MQAHVPSASSARDAVSIPREFDNEILPILRAKLRKEIARITELSTYFSYHSDHSERNYQMETGLN